MGVALFVPGRRGSNNEGRRGKVKVEHLVEFGFRQVARDDGVGSVSRAKATGTQEGLTRGRAVGYCIFRLQRSLRPRKPLTTLSISDPFPFSYSVPSIRAVCCPHCMYLQSSYALAPPLPLCTFSRSLVKAASLSCGAAKAS